MNQPASPVLRVLLGGTFDPIHNGHLRMALDLREVLGEARVLLMPCQVPPHREQPGASAEQRLAMLRLALTGEKTLAVDERELDRPGPSYTADTLESIRREIPVPAPLAVAMGTDAFASLGSWHRWERIVELAHLIVIERPGFALPETGAVAQYLDHHRVADMAELWDRPAGGVWTVHLTHLDISATDIRRRIGIGRSARFLLPDTVWVYIQQKGLYGARQRSASMES